MAIVINIQNKSKKTPQFNDIKNWYNQNLAPDAVDFFDQRVYENVYHKGKWAGIFQCTGRGSQNFFMRGKPRSIVDIATLTSIYRPGPLAAKVDDLYVDARNGKQFDWGDQRVNKILEKTNGLLIFQEQMLQLAHEVGGFPLDECDKLRKAIMKRTIGGGEEAIKKAASMRDGFVTGAIANGYDKKTAEGIYDKMLYFSGYAFNKSHAVAYAMDSFFCAYLMTYHEDEWMCSYLKSMSSNPINRAKAFSEIRGLGYKIQNLDINYSNKEWTALPGKKLVPSFLSFKGIGETAVDEIISSRPYTDLESMLWNPDGSWRLSKFNKRALESLILVEGLESLNCVGENKLFKNYRHMHNVIIGAWNDIKKSTKRNPFQGRDAMRAIALATLDCDDWVKEEKLKNVVDVVGSADITMLIPQKILDKLIEKGVSSIDDIEEDQSDVGWYCIKDIQKKKSKNGKPYTLIDAIGPVGKSHKIFVWYGNVDIKKMSICISTLERSSFGFSTNKIVTLA